MHPPSNSSSGSNTRRSTSNCLEIVKLTIVSQFMCDAVRRSKLNACLQHAYDQHSKLRAHIPCLVRASSGAGFQHSEPSQAHSDNIQHTFARKLRKNDNPGQRWTHNTLRIFHVHHVQVAPTGQPKQTARSGARRTAGAESRHALR